MSGGDRFIDTVSKDARVLIQARMLPVGKALTTEQIDQVRRDYLNYTKKTGVFVNQVAKEVGYSASVISQWGNGNYDKGNAEAVARKINDWMERDARRRRSAMPVDYVPTEVAENMRGIAIQAAAEPAMAAIVVPAGAGKTMVMKVLTEELSGGYVYCDETLTPKEFLQETARAVGLRPSSRTMAQIKREVIDKLKGTNRPLLLDEAHRLKPQVFPMLRTIHDLADIAIVMAGTTEILDRINDQANARGQLASRCLRYNALTHAFDIDDPRDQQNRRPLFSREEIEALFAKSRVRFQPDAFQLVWSIACLPGHGCLRTALRIVRRARDAYGNKTLSRKMLLAVLPMTFGEQGIHLRTQADKHTAACPTKAA